MSGSSRTRLALLSLAVLAVALVGTLLVGSLRADKAGSSKDAAQRAGKADAAANGVWALGTSWVVKVPKDNAIVAPSPGEATRYTAVYRFAVEKHTGTHWQVRVKLDGAEGPFKDGYRLVYAEGPSSMVLKQVGLGKGPLSGAQHAPIVLGMDFPLETTYTATPKDRALKVTPGGPPGLPPTLPEGAGPPAGAPPKLEAPPRGVDPSRAAAAGTAT